MKLVLFHVLGWVHRLSEGPQGGFRRRCSPATLGVRQQPGSTVPQSVRGPTTAPNIHFPGSSWDVSEAILLAALKPCLSETVMTSPYKNNLEKLIHGITPTKKNTKPNQNQMLNSWLR